jgi:aminoglycoside/choline kinase family phosphotransferase
MSEATLPAPIATYLERRKLSNARVIPLTGDASDRRYFRVAPASGPSIVLALHAGPFDAAALPFVNVAALFEAIGVPIPRILDRAGELGILALEDLGDITLQSHLGAVSDAERNELYARAVECIRTMQARGRDLDPSRFLPYGLAFDEAKLMWEMDFFITHFLEAYRGATLAGSSRTVLTAELRDVVRELAAEPRVLCHRDYHSRNLMVHGERLFVIDFQDARMGPDTYDLVSLLRDSYVDLPELLVDRAIAAFAASRPEGSGSETEFRRRFDVMALQRNLKALGTFGFQATSRANPVYAQYVPRTLGHVRRNLDRTPRFARLREVLGEAVPELSRDLGA